MTKLIEKVQKVFIRHYEKEAVICDNAVLTYRELARKSFILVDLFAKQGVKCGQRVAIKLPNGIDFVLCYFAGIFGGITVIPINLNSPIEDINYILEVAKPDLIIDEDKMLEYPIDTEDEFSLSIKSCNESIASIFFTSGTTNKPKGVCHSFESLVSNVFAFNKLTGLNSSIRMMHVLPMGYMAGFLNTILSPILAGGTVVVAPQFNARTALNFWYSAMKQDINAIWLTPTMAALLVRLCRSASVTKWTEKKLKKVFVGTDSLPEVTKNLFQKKFGVVCLESYGMTEALLVSCEVSNRDQKYGTVGKLLPEIKIKTIDNGNKKEILIKTPFALNGYLSPDSKLVSPFKKSWLSTGDSGWLDDNQLVITGRIKDIIIHGGVNISPLAVEEVILRYNGVQDVAVIGVPHDILNEEVVAFVIMDSGVEFDKLDIQAYCRKYLHHDAVPTQIKAVNVFPESSTGKIKKQLLLDSLGV